MRAQAALAELQDMIWLLYPNATFRVTCGQDDPDANHLVATVDVEDTGAVLEAVMDRMMEIQIEDELPIFVIPVRPPERVRAMWSAALTQTSHVPALPAQS